MKDKFLIFNIIVIKETSRIRLSVYTLILPCKYDTMTTCPFMGRGHGRLTPRTLPPDVREIVKYENCVNGNMICITAICVDINMNINVIIRININDE